jgi:hypothetical protein
MQKYIATDLFQTMGQKMDPVGFSNAQLNLWWRESGRLLMDQSLDRSTRLFGAQFGYLWHISNNPKGLNHSEREFGKLFGVHRSQVHICLKRLQTFGYIIIEDAKNRRKLYIPTEKLTGKLAIDPSVNRGDVTGSTKPGESPEYTLYNKPVVSIASVSDYAEPPQWADISQDVSNRLKDLKIPQRNLSNTFIIRF